MTEDPAARRGATIAETLIVRAAERLRPKDIAGSVEVTLPSGRRLTFGRPGTGIDADIAFRNFKVVWQAVRRGSLGFCESYMAGDIDSRDMTRFIRFYLANRAAFDGAGRGIFYASLADRFFHLLRPNTRKGSRRNISAHYDLGNDFYAEWLDATMTYSAACFDGAGNSLEAAQRQKYARVIDALGLERGHTVLEIGCGWGGFAEEAAARGAEVHGITLSKEQLAFAERRLARAGFARRCQIELRDYRDTDGTYDRIASIEMIEAVGETHWPVYFRTLCDRLKPGGIAAIQGITIAESNFEAYRRGVDFIQRYIFPGGMLLTRGILEEQARRAGLILERAEHFGHHYATTLGMWRDRFENRWPQIARTGFDERFRRMWRLYLSYCEAGFSERIIDVGIYRLRKPA